MEALNITGVTENVVRYLRMNIIEGQLMPGQKLNEIELSSRLGISRPPLREGFRILENEHLIINLPRRGCYVTEVSMEDCHQIYQARELIESGAIDCFKANNIRELPEVASAFELAAQRSATFSNDSRTEVTEYHNPFPFFHINLIASTKNNWLIRFYNKITPTLARYQFMCYEPTMFDKVQEEHEQILKLIKMEDYERVKDTLKLHINSFFKVIERRIGKKIPSQ